MTRSNILTQFFLLIIFFSCSSSHASAQIKQRKETERFEKNSLVGKQKDNSYVVPTAQVIDAAGKTVTFLGRPVDLALSPDEKLLAVKNINNIVFFSTRNQAIIQTLPIPRGGNSFSGIQWSDNARKVWTTDTRGFLR